MFEVGRCYKDRSDYTVFILKSIGRKVSYPLIRIIAKDGSTLFMFIK